MDPSGRVSHDTRRGLWWKEHLFMAGLVHAAWSEEPDLNTIRTIVSQQFDAAGDEFDAKFLAQGAFNKVYHLHHRRTRKDYVVRVTLPVNPVRKTACEVATLAFLRRETTLPVPTVLCFDSSAANPIGFEYIVEDYMPGVQLARCWHQLSDTQRQEIVKKLAAYQAELFQHRFRNIGGLTKQKYGREQPGKMAGIQLFWYERYKDTVDKGPFRSTHDWVKSLLTHALHESERLYEEELTEFEEDDCDFRPLVQNLRYLIAHLPQVLADLGDPDVQKDASDPPILRALNLSGRCYNIDPEDLASIKAGTSATETTLYHMDLSAYNILIDPHTARITGIIDWENISAVPLWKACELPAFLSFFGKRQTEKPEKDNYDDQDQEAYNQETKTENFDNEGKHARYWLRMYEWQTLQLQPIFLKEMNRLCPEWVKLYEKSAPLRDFASVLNMVNICWEAQNVREWIDRLMGGQRRSFYEICFEKEPIRIADLIEDVDVHGKEDEVDEKSWTPAMLPDLVGSEDHMMRSDVIILDGSMSNMSHDGEPESPSTAEGLWLHGMESDVAEASQLGLSD